MIVLRCNEAPSGYAHVSEYDVINIRGFPVINNICHKICWEKISKMTNEIDNVVFI